MLHYLGVDVGTSSVRCGLFNQKGRLIDSITEKINVYNFKVDFFEQSSEEIFLAVCSCIRKLKENNCDNGIRISIESIVSIGVDATCSLVVLDDKYKPISVSACEKDSVNVIMWMDHRAKKQAEYINSLEHECLKSVGGKISLEMDPPKILWLKENLYEKCYKKAFHFFSLADYIVFRLTNQNVRSVCCTTCKWLYISNESKKEWDASFWNEIGLVDLVEGNFCKIGSKVEKPFKYLEDLTISNDTVNKTGLNLQVKVGVSMIDAHAGGVGGLHIWRVYNH